MSEITSMNKVEIPVAFEKEGPYLPVVLDTILRLRKTKGMTLYFRGEWKEHEYVIPSLYRTGNSSIVLNGSESYYRKLFNELGKDDYDGSASLVRSISEFRHFGAITRIIDVSKNPLAALYFSAEGADDEDGYIYIFASDSQNTYKYEKTKKEKYDTGHTIAIKTALNLMPQSEIDDFLSGCEVFIRIYSKTIYNNMYGNISENNINFHAYTELSRMTLDEVIKQSQIMLEFNLNEPQWKEDQFILNIAQRNISKFMQLLNQRARVREELIYPLHIYFDLCRAHLFISSMNTTRISRQRGAFIFPAYVKTYENGRAKDIKTIQEEIQASIFEFLYPGECGNTIRIPSRIKSELRNELYLLGIDGGFLYADIQHKSDALLSEFKQENN